MSQMLRCCVQHPPRRVGCREVDLHGLGADTKPAELGQERRGAILVGAPRKCSVVGIPVREDYVCPVRGQRPAVAAPIPPRRLAPVTSAIRPSNPPSAINLP